TPHISALVVKLVDAPDSKSGSARSAGSSPARGTTDSQDAKTAMFIEPGGFFMLVARHPADDGVKGHASNCRRSGPRETIHGFQDEPVSVLLVCLADDDHDRRGHRQLCGLCEG